MIAVECMMMGRMSRIERGKKEKKRIKGGEEGIGKGWIGEKE